MKIIKNQKIVWKCVSVSVYMAWRISLFMLNLHFCEYIHLQVSVFSFPLIRPVTS